MSKNVVISQVVVHGELLKIESKADDKTKKLVHRLFFKIEEYDKGLEEFVPKSIGVKVIEDHDDLYAVYNSKIGQVISVPVTFVSFDGKTHYSTAGVGLLNLVEQPLKVDNKV